jgi:ribokinase
MSGVSRARILVVGSSNTDLVVRTKRIPQPGETVLGGDLMITPGGKGANQAVAAARLGATVSLLARIGTDMFGDYQVESIAASGVSTEFIVRDSAAPSGVALISVDESGQNSILVSPGSNARLTPNDVQHCLSAFQEADIVLLQLEIPLATVRSAIDMAKRLGNVVILNPAPALPLPSGFLDGMDVVTPNLQEALDLLGTNESVDPGQAARALLEVGIRTAVVTMGANGAVAANRDSLETIPGRRVEVLDTTAAGDCFTAGLAVALGEKQSLISALRFANTAASISVSRHGAQISMPTRQEVDHILA